MADAPAKPPSLSPEILEYYARGGEAPRLLQGMGQLEFARTQELLSRFLPAPPAVIFDVGGGSGLYSCWLARVGYEVHLLDPVPLHIAQARTASRNQPDHPLASMVIGDARRLGRRDGSVDAVLLFGPLYHLTERDDRLTALREARRILCDGGLVFAVGISRFASTLDGLIQGFLDDPEFVRIVQRDLAEGQHRNPSWRKLYFTTAFLCHPDELRAELEAAGLRHQTTLAIEGPAWAVRDFEQRWRDEVRRERLLEAIRWLEDEPSLLGASAHIMAIARKDG